MLLALITLLGVLSHTLVRAQECADDIPDELKRDCYPWHIDDDAAGEQLCEEMGCIWCNKGQGLPACFFNDLVCPSEIPEGERVDCHPEPDATKEECLRRGCAWCIPEAGGPACFYDDDVNQGGEGTDVCDQSDIVTTERIDCHPEVGAGHDECLARGCYWCEAADASPWCFMPKEHGYRMVGDPVETPGGYQVVLKRANYPSWYGLEIEDVLLEVEFQSDSRLRMKFTDMNAARFEVPIALDPPQDPGSPETRLYDVQFSTEPVFSIQVVRRSSGAVLFDTSIGGLMFSDQFIQIATYLNSEKVIGFGEHEHHSLLHDMNWQTWGMWTRDIWVSPTNLYGQQPFYMNIEQNNDAHGVLFFNANAQDVSLQPHPALVFRTIGGILDMHMFLGPSPEQVTQQLTEAVGRPVMVPYWSLGFQLCRWGYQDLDHMKQVVSEMRAYDIPHDVQYGDIDYMYEQRDFTIDPENFAGLPEYVDQLKAEGTRFVIILDPGISNQYDPNWGEYKTFDRGQEADVWIKESDGQTPAEGEVWPGLVYYPDFSNPATQDWWTTECVDFKNELDYVGLWIDMNEPSSFIHGSPEGCPDDRWHNPRYLPAISDDLITKTLCMNFKQYGMQDHYNMHSLYGYTMSEMSFSAAREAVGDRSVVFSRSTFPGTGRYAQHWLGDNFSAWSNLRWSVIGSLEFNAFGFPYVGADICGFFDPAEEEMCTRWQQLGAFYTFSRNHNADGNPDQHPPVWESVAIVTRDTLHIRYTLLPYLYTLFHYSHVTGSTVMRPLLNNFIQDANTHSVHDQLMWGEAFLISPVLDEGARSVNCYFPQARWYSYYDGAEVPVSGGSMVVDAPLDFIPLHVRGGYILPTQRPGNSTLFTRQLPMGLIVALDESGSAAGSLFWDDGLSIDTFQSGTYFMASYALSAGTLMSTVEHAGYPEVDSLMMEDVRVMGEAAISSVTINGDEHASWSQDPTTMEIIVSNAGVAVNSEFTITWT